MVSVVANCVKQKKDECPAAVDGGTPPAPRARAAVHPERAQFSNILFGEKKKKKNPQMLNFSTVQWDSLNCTCKSGNVGQACKICVHSLLSLFSSVVVNVVEKENGTILPILYECLICIQVFISTF